jgi:hypothetical protein
MNFTQSCLIIKAKACSFLLADDSIAWRSHGFDALHLVQNISYLSDDITKQWGFFAFFVNRNNNNNNDSK